MSSNPLFIRFPDRRSAYLAMDMLEELGYNVGVTDSPEEQELCLHLEKNDVTTALEIIQTYGGVIVDPEIVH
jgi:hypothetical protein